MFFDTPKRDYEAFMKNHPRWPRCLSIPYNGRLVWTCHEELAQKALKEIKSIKRVVNDLKCPQCGEKEIIYEISHAYIQMGGDGGQRKYYKVFFVCGDYLEIPLNTET
ncbi:hypothetical protein AMJ50_01085 [Parcubacteria bacterium DG_74_3]|nr:MAG: hypothetical protein AMJ50_01085 [Parcubacteria bacterium DG_74_3]